MRQLGRPERRPAAKIAVRSAQNFPTVSYRFSSPEGVRSDVTEARKGSSCAKHCNLLIPFVVGNGVKKIPLPAPHISKKPLSSFRNFDSA